MKIIPDTMLTQQIIKEYVLEVIMNVHLLTQYLIQQQENVFIAILKDLKMVNALLKI